MISQIAVEIEIFCSAVGIIYLLKDRVQEPTVSCNLVLFALSWLFIYYYSIFTLSYRNKWRECIERWESWKFDRKQDLK